MLKWAFIFVQTDADSQKNRATVNTPTSNLTVVGVKVYNEAAKTAKSTYISASRHGTEEAVRRTISSAFPLFGVM